MKRSVSSISPLGLFFPTFASLRESFSLAVLLRQVERLHHVFLGFKPKAAKSKPVKTGSLSQPASAGLN